MLHVHKLIAGHLKSPLEPSFFKLHQFVYTENNQYPIRWVAGSSIRAVQSLQLQQIGQLETYCFPTLVVYKHTKNGILTDFIEVLALQCIQFCRMMYKNHPDVYHFLY